MGYREDADRIQNNPSMNSIISLLQKLSSWIDKQESEKCLNVKPVQKKTK